MNNKNQIQFLLSKKKNLTKKYENKYLLINFVLRKELFNYTKHLV